MGDNYYVYDFEKDVDVARFDTSDEAHAYIKDFGPEGGTWFVVMDWPSLDDMEALEEAYNHAHGESEVGP